MKLITTFQLFIMLSIGCLPTTVLHSQIVVNNGACDLDINIPDFNCVQVAIPISNAPGTQLGQDVFLEEVRLIISHVWRNDLQLKLISPDGNTEIKLISERGAGGFHFGNPASPNCSEPLILSESICTMDSIKNIVQSTKVVGAFVPEESFSNFYLNTPFDPNDNWTLEICDDKPGDSGMLDYVELIFVPLGCPAPTNLEVFNLSATSVDLAWNNNGQCNNIVVEYGPEGFTPGNGTTTGSVNSQVVVLNCVEEFDLLGLNQLTTYDIYVRQLCNTYNYAYNSCKITATTDCILPPVTLSENFNTQQSCNADGTCLDCPTITGVWKNAITDDIDWIVNSGSTITSNTGPSNDADPNGQYIYLESSGTCKPSKEAILISDCIEVDASTGICHLSFYYHMYGINVNALFLEITTDGINWLGLWGGNGDQGDEWIKQYIDLSAYQGRIVQFRFRGVSASINFRGDIGLDRIIFYGSQLKASDIYYADLDNDGFGNQTDSVSICFAAPPAGYVSNKLDCDDSNPTIHPNASEIPCNGIDENCNGISDDIIIFTPSFAVSPICNGETATITVSPSNAGQIYWFDNSTGGIPIDSGIIFTRPQLDETTIYYFQETENFSGQPCTSNIIPVEIIVNTKPDITNASGNQSICENTLFDLRDLIIQDANNVIDTILFFANDSYSNFAQINNPRVVVSSDSVFYIQAKTTTGCTDELAVSFFKKPTPKIDINIADTLELCFQSDPQLITASEQGGGIGPYDYQWSTGAQGKEAIVFSRSKDFYQTLSVTVTSQSNGCSARDQLIVHTLPSISTIQVVDIQEPGFCQENGSIIINPLDGQGPYDYAWSGAVSGLANQIEGANYSISNLATGAYNITVTDNAGCSKTLPQQFVNGTDLGIDNITDVSCFGANNGAITISIGGLINPTFQWSDGNTVFSTFQNVSALSGGVYSVLVDADNVSPCPIDSIIVLEPPILEILNKNAISPSCPGLSDASIELAVTGGNPTADGNYNFNWENGLGNTANPQNLLAGNYQVTITDTKNCTSNDTILINPTPVLTLNLIGIDPKCTGQDDGEISSQVTGGTSPYNYEWNDNLNQTTAIAYGLIAKNYLLKVTDANGCEVSSNTTLIDPIAITAQVARIQSPLCNEISNGIINLEVNGGTGTYNYLWNTAATTTNLVNVGAGNYDVTVSDQNECTTFIDSIMITAPELMDIHFTTLKTPLCIGVDNGQIEASVNGGVAPYDFAWNNGASTPLISNLRPDNYQVEVTDANGCISLSDTAYLLAPQLISINNFLTIDSIQCKGSDNGVVFYNIKSDAPAATTFSFKWQDSSLITDNSNGFWLSSDFTNLSAGNYHLQIMDNIGCSLNTSFDLNEPALLKIDTILVEPPTCFGENDGNAIAVIQGGTAPFRYNWTLPNNRIVGTTDGVLQGIDGGNYKLEIIDANNCVSAPYNFEVESSSPIQIQVTEIRDVSCSDPEGGLININASGGREGIDFEWNNGLITEDLSNLDVGIYTVTLTDGAECTLTRSFEINLIEDSLNVTLIEIDNPSCDGSTDGKISIKVNGGFGRYQYFWNTGVQEITGDSIELQGLSAGNYEVSVIDENNDYLCVGYIGNINLIPEGSISVNLDNFENELACFGDKTGTYAITPNGGTAPYQYFWSNGATSQDIENLPAGNYTLTITDANNCAWSSGALFPEILEPENAFQITTNFVTDSLCVGDDSGQINLAVSGGTLPYNINWSNGAQTAVIQNLLPGNYSLVANDQNGCTIRLDTSISIKAEPLALELSTADLTCFGDNSGFIQAKVTCGLPPYQYVWNTGDTTKNLDNLTPGEYGVTITDAAGEILTTATEIRSPSLLKIDTTTVDIINCEGVIELKVSGGVSNSYNYTWRDDLETIISTTNKATGLGAGKYDVTIQDANNCQIILNDLSIDNELIIDSVSTSSIFNRQSNRGTLRVDTVLGGTAPYSYLWYNQSGEIIGTGAEVTGVIIGDYYVIVSDPNGCEKRQDQTLDISDPIIELPTVESFKLYPNPTNHSTHVALEFSKNVAIELVLLDGVGRQLFQIEKVNIRAIQQEIDLSNYSTGLFYIKITVDDYPAFGEKILFIKN